MLALCDALDGDRDDALRYAAAIECVHAASLIHDDLVDEDRVRRGRPATWVVHGTRRAVLLADVMFATALQRSAELGTQGVVSIARAISRLAAGAYGEPLLPGDIDPLDQGALYERTIRLKTGSLFCAAAELGAIAAGARSEIRHAASQFGMRIGEAYQIADDLADIVRGGDVSAPDEVAMLSALLAYFDPPYVSPHCSSPRTTDMAPQFDTARLSDAMEAEIDRLLVLARSSLDALPETPRIALLRQMPVRIVRASTMRAVRPRGATPPMAQPSMP